jgi:hypothetical protein
MQVVTSVNEPYLDLLDIWRRQSGAIIGRPPLICCMDAVSADRCAGWPDVETVRPASVPNTRHRFWLERFDSLARCLEVGDILHSDADAFWLSPPWELLAESADDLVFSREFGIPRSLVRKWGFVLCCGWFAARSTPATRAFFGHWRALTARRMDDQLALNELLAGLGAVWTPARCGDHNAARCTVSVDGHRLSILVLDHETITRDPPYAAGNALIAHPYFERQFFRSYVDLLHALFDETGGLGKVAFPRHEAGQPEAKARDISTFHALEWLLSRRNGTSAMWAHLGALHARRGEGEAAATALQTSLDLGPADGWTRLSLGNGLSALGRRREAVAVLQRLGDSADLEFDVARKGAALLARLGAPAAAAALGVRAAQLVGLSGAITLARRYARQRAAAG